MSGRLGFQSSIIHCFSAAKKIVVIAARSILQSGSVLMKVLGGGEEEEEEEGDISTSCFTVSTGVVKLTELPFILGGAWAFALTCKPPEEVDFDFIPPKFASFFGLELGSGADGEGTGMNAEVAAVATMLNFFFLPNSQLKIVNNPSSDSGQKNKTLSVKFYKQKLQKEHIRLIRKQYEIKPYNYNKTGIFNSF